MIGEFLCPRVMSINTPLTRTTFARYIMLNEKRSSPKVGLDQNFGVAHKITVYDLNNPENCNLVYGIISNKIHLMYSPEGNS